MSTLITTHLWMHLRTYSGIDIMRRRGFDFGEFEITKREILASISIIAVLLLIGFVISGKISNYILDRNEKYNKAVKIEDSGLFEYGMRTNIGDAFIYGVNTQYTGTIFTELRDKTISDNSPFYEDSTIDETIDYLETGFELWMFWVIWIIVIGLCVFGFYYIDNEWLEN